MIVDLDVWFVFWKLLFEVRGSNVWNLNFMMEMLMFHEMCCHAVSPWTGDIPCWKLCNTPHCKSFNRTKTETPKWNPANLLQGNLQNDFLVATVHKTSSWRVVQLKNMTIHWVPRPNLGRPVCVRNAILSCQKRTFRLYFIFYFYISQQLREIHDVQLACLFWGVSCFEAKKRRQIWASNLHSTLSLMMQAHRAPCLWSPETRHKINTMKLDPKAQKKIDAMWATKKASYFPLKLVV